MGVLFLLLVQEQVFLFVYLKWFSGAARIRKRALGRRYSMRMRMSRRRSEREGGGERSASVFVRVRKRRRSDGGTFLIPSPLFTFQGKKEESRKEHRLFFYTLRRPGKKEGKERNKVIKEGKGRVILKLIKKYDKHYLFIYAD